MQEQSWWGGINNVRSNAEYFSQSGNKNESADESPVLINYFMNNRQTFRDFDVLSDSLSIGKEIKSSK